MFRNGTAIVLALAVSSAANARYPSDAGVVDVTKPPYSAKRDGTTDDTKAIQRALDDHPNQGAIIYLPNGTYKITDTLRWPKGNYSGAEEKNTILEGESRHGTVLRLPDGCPGYTDPAKPKPMLWTGNAPAQRFRNAVRSLTVNTGRDNPGAVGVQFMANNQGGVFDVTVRSADGGGPIGLDLGYTDENGPLLVKDVRVEGFEVGVRTGFAVDSVTMEDVTVTGQRVAGVRNSGQVLNVRKLFSENSCPAVINDKGPGVLTLIDSRFAGLPGAEGTVAIVNEATIFARNIVTSGYKSALASPGEAVPVGPLIDEFVHPAAIALFDGPRKSLGLRIEETPDVPADDHANWVSVKTFGAGGNDYHNRDRNDDTPAFQKAIDSGATTIYVPCGFYVLNDTVVIRGKVRRIHFLESALVGGKGFDGSDKPAFRFEDGDHPVVVLERFNETFGSRSKVWVEHASKRTLVIKNAIIMGRYDSVGGGRVFLDDVCGGPFRFRNQDVWARQLNQESEGTHVVNDGGRLWVLGYKTERGGTLLETENGQTEVLGCFAYCTTGVSKAPMFVVKNSSFSATMGEAHFGGRFDVLVEETRDKQTRRLNRADAPSRFGIGALLPLYASSHNP